eukprot:1173218-Rhodomonas_salina.2
MPVTHDHGREQVREARAGIYVEGATSHFVTSEREVHDLLKTGAGLPLFWREAEPRMEAMLAGFEAMLTCLVARAAARAVGETQMNQQVNRGIS